MIIRSYKITGLIVTLLLLVAGIAGCTSADPDPYNSEIKITGIEDPAHVEHFRLTNTYNDASVTFVEEDVSDGTLTAEITGLQGEVSVILAIDNNEIEGLDYGDEHTRTVTRSDSEASFNLSSALASFNVNINKPENGFINAQANGNTLNYGDNEIEVGSDIEFYYRSGGENEYYDVVNWRINNRETDQTENEFTYFDLKKDIEVGVEIAQRSNFKVEIKDVEILDSWNMEIKISYKIENTSNIADEQVIRFKENDQEIESKKVYLQSQESIEDDFVYKSNNIEETDFLFEIISENTMDSIRAKFVDDSLKFKVDNNMPPDMPEDVLAIYNPISNNVKISWSEVEEAVSYHVVRKTDGLGNDWMFLDVRDYPYYVDSDINYNNSYRYAIVAVDEDGQTSDYAEYNNEVEINGDTNDLR